MHPGRVDVIGAGALILARIMARFGFAEVLVSEHDILDGIAWSLGDRREADGACRRGTGWPDDPAAPETPVARTRGEVVSLAAERRNPGRADRAAVGVPGLPAAGQLARGRGRHAAQVVPGRAVLGAPHSGLGRPGPEILIVGLAPAAHGGNRTGRIFTGDRSGDFLFAALHRCGLAALPTSVAAGDGQQLTGARMVAAVRCAPPDNKPTPAERDCCAPWLAAEIDPGGGHPPGDRLPRWIRLAGGVVSAGRHRVRPAAPPPGVLARRRGIAARHGLTRRGLTRGQGASGPLLLLGCYHPSQQNTFTGRVTRRNG